MPLLHVERIGGFAGFGGAAARVRSHGNMDVSSLSAAEQQAVEALFQKGGHAGTPPMPDEFRYKISRATPTGTDVIEAPESLVPAALVQCVKDELV